MDFNNHRTTRKNIELHPPNIRFTQDSIAMCFQDGQDLNKTCEDIALGNVTVNDLPKIRVILVNGVYYSFDNRRLYVFRVLEKLGFLDTVSVLEVNQITREITTANGGCHVKIRSRPVDVDSNKWKNVVIYHHCSCLYQRKGTAIPGWWDNNRKCHRSCGTNTQNVYSTSYSNDYPYLSQERIAHTYNPQWHIKPNSSSFKSETAKGTIDCSNRIYVSKTTRSTNPPVGPQKKNKETSITSNLKKTNVQQNHVPPRTNTMIQQKETYIYSDDYETVLSKQDQHRNGKFGFNPQVPVSEFSDNSSRKKENESSREGPNYFTIFLGASAALICLYLYKRLSKRN